ncbi:MAG: hypothetical protein LUQ66_08375 [Methanoregula sp.]|nr:hypothetical protein [Methanoregula sp.]
MQLPRGTFREIRKKATIGGVLSELEQTRFTGTCSIFAGPATGTFVFREGACILAKFRGEPGDAGWNEMKKSEGEPFDVILSTLDETQVKLSLEFNPACRIVKGEKAPVAHPAASPVAPASPAPKRPVITAVSPVPAIRHKALTSPAAPRVVAEPPPVTGEETIESDLDALDTMDLDHVTARIRSDCKTLVKQLNLEHLMER